MPVEVAVWVGVLADRAAVLGDDDSPHPARNAAETSQISTRHLIAACGSYASALRCAGLTNRGGARCWFCPRHCVEEVGVAEAVVESGRASPVTARVAA